MNSQTHNCSILDLISKLNTYWQSKGFDIVPSYDMPMGAATFHPLTFFNALTSRHTPDKVAIAYYQPCRRPSDSNDLIDAPDSMHLLL